MFVHIHNTDKEETRTTTNYYLMCKISGGFRFTNSENHY